MRKTRLVILPTKCLHQMGFLLLFLSCPVIGDWGRIRPESENSHKAIQIDREGTCGLQRDPPGKLLNYLYENGSDQCQPSKEFDSDGITKKPIFREARRFDERRVDSRRMTRDRNVRESERREVNDERKNVRKAMQRVADERRNIREEVQKGIRRDVRKISKIRSKSPALQQPSIDRRQENNRAARQQTLISARLFSRNDRERLPQNRRMAERQNERRTEQQRLSIREITSEGRENERTVRTFQEIREQTRRLVRSVERENQGIRRDNQRSVRERSLQVRYGDVRTRRFRERDQDKQNERLSLARKDENSSRRSERGRNVENSERRFSQIRKTRIMEIDGEVIEQRLTRNLDNRRDIDGRKPSGGAVGERRGVPLNVRMDRDLELKSMRVRGAVKQEHLIHDVRLEKKSTDEKLSGGTTKWMDLKRYESVKVGDWTINCVIGAVVYFFSTRQIKAV